MVSTVTFAGVFLGVVTLVSTAALSVVDVGFRLFGF